MLRISGLVLAVAALVVAPPARADVDPVAVEYARVNAWRVCTVLAGYPSAAGVLGIVQAVTVEGLTEVQAEQAVGVAVINECPHLDRVLNVYALRYGTQVNV